MNKSTEPIILAVVLGIVALSVGALAFWFPSLQDITGVASTVPKPHSPPKLKAEEIQANLAPWSAPVLWTAPDSGNRLFVSDDYLFFASEYPGGDYIRKKDKKLQTASGVLVSWYQKYGIDFTDANADREDPDGDGFSNIVEFKNEQVGQRVKAADCDGTKSSNPRDPDSHPPYLSRLRLDKYESRPFHIQFRGYQVLNGETVFQIYLKDVNSSQQPGLKKTGDKLGYEGYTVGQFESKPNVQVQDPATKTVETEDQSVLWLEKPEIGFKIPLTFRKEVDSPESTANFVMLMPTEVDKVIKVPRGKTFAVPYISDRQYILIDVKDTGATIRDTKDNQTYTIPKLDPDEWNEVPQSAQAPAPKTP